MTENATISGLQLWEWSKQAKQDALAVDISPIEVDWLLEEWAGLDRLSLRLGSYKDIASIKLRLPWLELMQLWGRRLQERVPLQYLTGVANWRHFELMVSPAVLIPRPETELIIDVVVALVQRQSQSLNSQNSLKQGHWVDLGTGSGAIALGLASRLQSTA